MVNILDMHWRHGGFDWRVYDECFRRVRALAPSMPWHLTNWDVAMDAIQTVVVRQSDTLQLLNFVLVCLFYLFIYMIN